MSTVNKVILIGNIGKDPEIKAFDNGGKIATFSIATSEKFTDKQGEKQEITDWHDIKVTFSKLAEVVEKYLKIGSKVYVEGKIRTESWDDQNGNKQYRKWVYANSITMLGGKNEDSQPVQAKPESPAPTIEENDEDGLPF